MIPSTPASPAPRRPDVPAEIERAVRLRDGDRCVFPLGAGGACGSTWLVELDHVVPLARGGATTPANLRCLCARHNRMAAEAELGTLARRWWGCAGERIRAEGADPYLG